MTDDTLVNDIKELVSDTYWHIVDYPEELDVDVFLGERITVVAIKPNAEDVPKVIGRKGQNVNSVKTFLESFSISRGDKRRFYVEVKSSKD